MTERKKRGIIFTALGGAVLVLAIAGSAIGGSAPPITDWPPPSLPGTRSFGHRAAPGTEVSGLTLPESPAAGTAAATPPTLGEKRATVATIYRNGRYEQVYSVITYVEEVTTGPDGKAYTAAGWRQDIDSAYQQPAIAVSSLPDGPFVSTGANPPPPAPLAVQSPAQSPGLNGTGEGTTN